MMSAQAQCLLGWQRSLGMRFELDWTVGEGLRMIWNQWRRIVLDWTHVLGMRMKWYQQRKFELDWTVAHGLRMIYHY